MTAHIKLEGAVTAQFDPFIDIDWDAPEFEIRRDDPRWVLPETDPVAHTDWYRNLPLDRRIEVGLWRQAGIAKAGLQFESILIQGTQQFVMRLPNNAAEFRHCGQEMIEAHSHIQMLQELINRIGADVPGMSRRVKRLSPYIGMLAYFPTIFFILTLASKEPKTRSQPSDHPLLHLITGIHLAEEERRIGFAREFIVGQLEDAGRLRRAALSLLLPIILRVTVNVTGMPHPKFQRTFDVPDETMRQAFWRSEHSRNLLRDSFTGTRAFAEDIGLLTARTRWLWRLLNIEEGKS
ncbi:diiron oxygenase [Pseudonocardiaceae bacterium YIM PH 21723]|nr:diiron oxygenase [Pseudonocardiaceae bacterium YIM PH 21723]